jgi:DNA-binding response OmpR family regulator
MSSRSVRVLVVEDDALVAMSVQDCLEAAGYEVVALAGSLSAAIALASTLDLDAAVLDLNLGGEMSFPVVETLRQRKVPVVICSGYKAREMPQVPKDVSTLEKPVPPDVLVSTLAHAIGGCGQAGRHAFRK